MFASELERINPLIEIPYQRVRCAVLIDRPPSQELGELTPTGKLVRKKVLSNHQPAIESMFADRPPECVVKVPQPQSARACAHAG